MKQDNRVVHFLFFISLEFGEVCMVHYWIFRTPLLINSLTINSVFINRAYHHGFFVDDYQDKGSAGRSMVLGSHTSMAVV